MNQEDSKEVFNQNYKELLDALNDDETNESSNQPLETQKIWNRHTRRRFNQAMKKAHRKKLCAGTPQWKRHFREHGFRL